MTASFVLTMARAPTALAQTPQRRRVEVRVLGRLESRPRVVTSGEETTIVGSLSDETGLPVAGGIAVLAPTPEQWRPCQAAPTKRAGGPSLTADARGYFCLRGPLLPDTTQIRLRLTGDGYQTRELDLLARPTHALPPRILAAPEVIALDAPSTIDVDAVVDGGDAADGDVAELFIECRSTLTRLGQATAKAGHFHFAANPSLVPSPGNCWLSVRTDVDSSPRAVVVQSRARLRAGGWKTSDSGARQAIHVDLEWDGHRAPLTVGVLEGRRGQEHVLTVPLSDDGEGTVELEDPPVDGLSVRLARAPAYVSSSNVLFLPPPEPWAGWPFLQAAGLLGLGIWLALSWRSGDKKPAGDHGRTQLGPFGPSKRGVAASFGGRAVDLHTGRPIAANVEVLRLAAMSQEVVGRTAADEGGRFSFPFERPGHARLRSTAEGYVTFEGPLPPGPALVRMTERRRAALSILMTWLRGRPAAAGGPLAAATPGEIEARARASGEPTVAEWAGAVATATYGATPPTDADLSALDERKPS